MLPGSLDPAGNTPANPAMYELVTHRSTPARPIPRPALRASVEGNKLPALISGGWIKQRSITNPFMLLTCCQVEPSTFGPILTRSGVYLVPSLVISSLTNSEWCEPVAAVNTP